MTISGTPKTSSVRAGSGMLSTRSLCSDCGSPLFTRGEAAPEVMSVRFPTLDNPSFSTPGTGQEVSGQMLRMEQIITHEDAEHETKDQYFMSVDGVATKWLAKRYSYIRRH